MPSPPITIGELTDVPAFNSPIASPWAQEASRRITHRFATAAERDTKYPAATAGAGAVCVVTGAGQGMYISDGATWWREAQDLSTYHLSAQGGPDAGGLVQGFNYLTFGTVGPVDDPWGMLERALGRTITIKASGWYVITVSFSMTPAPAAATQLIVSLPGNRIELAAIPGSVSSATLTFLGILPVNTAFTVQTYMPGGYVGTVSVSTIQVMRVA